MTEDLQALHTWVRLNFPTLEAAVKRDAQCNPYLRVSSSSCHPVLLTSPSVHLNIFFKVDF